MNYVGPLAPTRRHYVTDGQWDAMPNVANDTFQNVSSSANGLNVVRNSVVQGVRVRAA